MAGSTTWLFRQLAGPEEGLTLDGWSAPFGRPRQGAIVEDAIEIRQAEVYYPGDDTGPTRHVFGIKYPDRELHGRFRDRARGVGYARAKVLECKQFVAAQQPVRVTWSDQLSEVGFIKSFKAGRESEGEIEWRLTYGCDRDDFNHRMPLYVVPKLPVTFALSISAAMDTAFQPPLAIPEMRGSIFDALDTLVSVAVYAASRLLAVAGSLDGFEVASFGELRRLVGLVAEVRDAVTSIQTTFADAQIDSLLLRDDAASNVRAWRAQTEVDLAILQMLSDAADIDRQAAIALAGRPARVYVAKGGDTWEGISVQEYGTPDRAGDLWAAAGGIEYPIPGFQYQVPA